MGKPVRLAGPLALTTTLTTNVYQGAGGSALLTDIVRHIHVANKTTSDATFTLYLGATGANAAGTELFWKKTVKAGDVFDWPCYLPLSSTDYLVGGSDTATALSIEISGDRIVA